ncbi:hypothetical protein Pmani_013817 [Petrolisthes manimaculis]|uniref:Cytochrome P450 n=1 Tax=Petrolisthes manimaculis TaxID=1843537 RepID=A0AAE1PV85_9EUCA|nr:hypothetical protein Pmani_013817 [Petrolisthes manimaculis]
MLTLVLTVLLTVALLLYYGTRKPRGFPPGPPRLPIVGFLPFMDSHLPHKQLWRLSSTYGPVVGLYFGVQPAIVVNGWDANKEALLNDDLNGRPTGSSSTIPFDGKDLGVMFVNGDLWKEQRRFTLHQFRNLGFAKKSHEVIIHEVAEELIKDIKQSQCSITLQNKLGVCSIIILWAVMGGARLERSDPLLTDLVDRLNKLFRAGQVSGGFVEVFPPLRHILPETSPFNIVLNGRYRILSYLRNAVEEHKATHDPDNPRDFIDIYITQIKNEHNNSDSTFTEDQLLATCFDVFSAGAETGSSSVSFAILLMILYPSVGQAVQRELDEVVGLSRFPSVDDRTKLVYTEATLAEISRFRGVAPFTVPHYAVRDTILQGKRIPAGTMVMNNLYSVHMDPEYWKDPDTFRPERFINPDGSLRKDEHLIPFGKGRRACLGESLARMTLFLMFTTLMQHFNFRLDPAIPVFDTEGKSGFTLGPPDFNVFAEPRS